LTAVEFPLILVAIATFMAKKLKTIYLLDNRYGMHIRRFLVETFNRCYI